MVATAGATDAMRELVSQAKRSGVLNNALQSIDPDAIDAAALAAARRDFGPRWIRWNLIRTVIATLVSVSLMIALLRL